MSSIKIEYGDEVEEVSLEPLPSRKEANDKIIEEHDQEILYASS